MTDDLQHTPWPEENKNAPVTSATGADQERHAESIVNVAASDAHDRKQDRENHLSVRADNPPQDVHLLGKRLLDELRDNHGCIPLALRAKRNWLVWRVTRIKPDGKFDKVPCYVSGKPRSGAQGSPEDRKQLGIFDDALGRVLGRPGYAGIGFALLDDCGIIALDVDGCVKDGVIDPEVLKVVDSTYAEISPSGRGIRAFWRGTFSGKTSNKHTGWELYGSGQFVTVTGNVIETAHSRAGRTDLTEIDRQTLEYLVRRCTPEKTTMAVPLRSQARSETTGGECLVHGSPREEDFFRNVNNAALKPNNMDQWVPQLFPGVAQRRGQSEVCSGWRVPSQALGRDLAEDISIHPAGIKDFGVHDMGDEREGKRTAIDLVMEHGPAFLDGEEAEAWILSKPLEAARWLCSAMRVNPRELGYRASAGEVIAELRKRPPEEIQARWVSETVHLDSRSAEEVVKAVAALTGMGKRALSTELKRAQRAVERERAQGRIEEGAAGRKPIEWEPQNSSRQAREVERLILSSVEPGRYVDFAGRLCCVRTTSMPGTHAIDDPSANAPEVHQIEHLTEVTVRELVQRVAMFTRSTKNGPSPIGVPLEILKNLLEKNDHAAPQISGLIAHPIALPDGHILSAMGLHPETGLFLCGEPLEELRPYDEVQARGALVRLRENFLRGFDFASELDADIALAGLFTGVQRRLLDQSPGLMVVAGIQATGKTTLARRIHLILTGRDMPVTPLAQGEEEVEKCLMSQLLRNPALVCFDNVPDGQTVRSPSLSAVMTSPVLEKRILGSNKIVPCPTNVLMVVTGNNLSLGSDEQTRWMMCRLDSRVARPEGRSFTKPDVVAHAHEIRDPVLRDVIGIIAGYVCIHRSLQNTATGSRFPKWDIMVRQPILWAGGKDVAQSFSQNAERDERHMALVQVLSSAYRKWGTGSFSAAELAALACEDPAGGLRDALEELGVANPMETRSVGKALSKYKDRPVDIDHNQMPMCVRLKSSVTKGQTKYRVDVGPGGGV